MKKLKVILVWVMMLVSGVSFSLTQSELEKYKKEAPQNGNASGLVGMHYYQNKDYSNALLYLKNALSLGVNNSVLSDTNRIVGDIYAMSQEYDLAIEHYEKALKYFLGNKYEKKQKIYYNLGVLYAKKGDYQLSTTYFLEAIKFGGEKALISELEIGLNYIDIEEYQKAYNIWTSVAIEDKNGIHGEKAKYFIKKYITDKGIEIQPIMYIEIK